MAGGILIRFVGEQTPNCAENPGNPRQRGRYLRVGAEGKFSQRAGFGQVDEQEEEGQGFAAETPGKRK